MKRNGFKKLMLPASFAIVIVSACSKKSSDETNQEPNNGGTASVLNLNLSQALDIKLNNSITARGTTNLTNLAGGNKSAEACRVRQSIKQSTDMLASIKSSICHIEAEASNVGFNKPILLKMKMSGGADGEMPPGGTPGGAPAGAPLMLQSTEQLIGIYVDSTDATATKVYVCGGEDKSSMELNQVFRILSTSDKKSKGEMFLKQGMAGTNFAASIVYDAAYTTQDTVTMDMKVKFDGSFQGQINGFSQYLNMKLVDGGVSFIQNSDSGAWQGSTMKNSGAARFDAENGQVLFALNTSYNGQNFDTNKQSCVDAAGVSISCSGDKFVTGGALAIDLKEVPGFLAANFEPAKPEGFDCKSASWTEVDVDLADSSTQERHSKCDSTTKDFQQEDCWNAAYQPSDVDAQIPPQRDDIPGE